ncbi:MAG: hypothetical protein R6X16_02210 [Anaerolineae bacterium]
MGIIDTLSAGFRLVFRRPWLAVVPLLIDLGVWLGPKLSMSMIVEQMLASLTSWSAGLAGSDQTVSEAVGNMVDVLQETVARTNLLGLLAWNSLGVPSVGARLPIQASDRVIQISQFWQLVVIETAILAVGLLLAAAYLILIGRNVSGQTLTMRGFPGTIVEAWARLALILVVIGVGVASASLASAILGPLSLVVFIGLMWILLYISFFPQAITLAGHKPLPAILSSYWVVRTSLWPTLGLLLLVNLLDTGLALVWQRLMGTASLGMLLAIIASSLIGTGLTAALSYFYRDRLGALRDLVTAPKET